MIQYDELHISYYAYSARVITKPLIDEYEKLLQCNLLNHRVENEISISCINFGQYK